MNKWINYYQAQKVPHERPKDVVGTWAALQDSLIVWTADLPIATPDKRMMGLCIPYLQLRLQDLQDALAREAASEPISLFTAGWA